MISFKLYLWKLNSKPMKKSFITLSIIMVTVLSFGQNQTQLVKTNNSKLNTTSASDSLKAIQIYNDDINRQVIQIDSHLNSIQIKWDYVMNNSSEKAIADENGWFDDMTRIKKELEDKKQVLINSLQ